MIAPYQHHCCSFSCFNRSWRTEHDVELLLQHFWIVKATSVVRRAISNCMHCRLRNANPGQQLMANLPHERLQVDAAPFAYSRVDYLETLNIRQMRSTVKRYGCLFTCLTTKAVHLKVAADLYSDSFINALQRFLSRRGPVSHLYFDNGTNLVEAEKIPSEAVKAWNEEHKLHNFLLQKRLIGHSTLPQLVIWVARGSE